MNAPRTTDAVPGPRQDAPRPGFLADLKLVGRVGGLAALGVTLASVGVQAALAAAFEPAITLGQALARTAPLTLALTFAGLAVVRRWFPWYAPAPILVLLAAALAWIGWLAHRLGIPGALDLATLTPGERLRAEGSRAFAAWVYLRGYYRLYGPGLFASSVITAAFLAWALGMRLLPHLARAVSRRIDAGAGPGDAGSACPPPDPGHQLTSPS